MDDSPADEMNKSYTQVSFLGFISFIKFAHKNLDAQDEKVLNKRVGCKGRFDHRL